MEWIEGLNQVKDHSIYKISNSQRNNLISIQLKKKSDKPLKWCLITNTRQSNPHLTVDIIPTPMAPKWNKLSIRCIAETGLKGLTKGIHQGPNNSLKKNLILTKEEMMRRKCYLWELMINLLMKWRKNSSKRKNWCLLQLLTYPHLLKMHREDK